MFLRVVELISNQLPNFKTVLVILVFFFPFLKDFYGMYSYSGRWEKASLHFCVFALLALFMPL